jgi:diguanylate cyclase (GGDEF)-like protein
MNLVSLESEAAQHAVEVAPRVWWVGDVLVGDPFQCHAYLIEAGASSILVDPGSSLTIEATLRKVQEVVPLDHIAKIVLHHSDPDVADSLHDLSRVLTRDDITVISEWRSALLLRHFAGRFPFELIEDLGWRHTLPDGRVMDFLLTPYLHFPGAFVTYLRDCHVLFSADLFGGFNRANRLWADSPADFEDLRQFHEHYMPSRDLLMAGLASISAAFPQLTSVLPQHGYLIPRPLLASMFHQLARLECGVMRISQSDTHLATLIEIAAAVRRVEDVLDLIIPLPDMMDQVAAELSAVLPLSGMWAEIDDLDEHIVRFDRDHELGQLTDGWTPTTELLHPLTLPSHPGDPKVTIVLETSTPWVLMPEFEVLLNMVAVRVRKVVDEAMRNRHAHLVELGLREEVLHDPLTGLLNRRALAEPRRLTGPAAVLMIDIDHFKRINDSVGHPVGDRVLRAVAVAVTEAIRHSDLAFRYGGEEILAIVALDHGNDQVETTRSIAERVRNEVQSIDPSPFGLESSVTVSVGAAVIEPEVALADNIHHADEALYRAKAEGRNRVKVARRAGAPTSSEGRERGPDLSRPR